ncbi:MAG: RNA polymerase sigma factor [Blastocatellia bacterium]|nr:RNA polymerase sigma factor [Blastocatellia bacterium]
MTDAKVQILIQQALEGDNDAFDRLMDDYRPFLYSFIRRHIKGHEDTEDILQEVCLNAYKAMRSGNYRYINAAAHIGWLKSIAWHTVIYHINRQEAIDPIEYVDGYGNRVMLDIPNPGRTVEHELECLWLFEFLEQQLDEALIKPEPSQRGKDIGLLKKIAFVSFYVDELGQKEVVIAVSEYAERLGVSADISQFTINNWLSRGDVLKLLIRHLIEKHNELIGKLADLDNVSASLDELEKNLLKEFWGLKKSEKLIAQENDLRLSDIEKTLQRAKQKVADALFKIIKKQLHDLRHQGTD